MCNLYNLSSKEDIELYFRALVWGNYTVRTVGPLGTGLFLRPAGGALEAMEGQWGMIPAGCPTRKPTVPARGTEQKPKPLSTNNARLETIEKARTFAPAWKAGRRCLIPASWYAEPNWESGKNHWWNLRRADGKPWALAGLWSEWVDPNAGEVVPNYTMITVNCDSHVLLNRLHRPDPKRPPDDQDKRALVHVEPHLWEQWLQGDEADAREVLATLPVPDFYDQADRLKMDGILAEQRRGEQPGLL